MKTSHGIETANQLRLRLIEQLRRTADRLESGCSDGYCHCKPRKSGMHTNGGCKCWHDARYVLKWAWSDVDGNRMAKLDCFPESRLPSPPTSGEGE